MTSKSFWNPQLWLACVWREGRAFFTLKDVKRHWLLPFASAVALGGPVLEGAWSQSLNAGMTASLGALIFLYLPQTAFSHMWRSMIWSCLVMLVCYGIGLFSSSSPFLQVPGLIVLTTLATLYCKSFNLGGPPGSLFFVIAASIGASSQAAGPISPLKPALVAAGCLWGFAVAMIYYSFTRSQNASLGPKASTLPWPKDLGYSVFIGMVVGSSLLLAQLLGLNNPYWVPISCLAVIQGSNLRDIWNKQLHRIVGTFLGVIWISLLFQAKPESDWQVAIWIVFLSFVIELTVARHYATAVMFITPMTILLANAAQVNESSLWSLTQSRLLDTGIGCASGLFGGICLHFIRRRDSTS